MPFPERRAAPQAIELFDLAIAFWFGHRQENQFDAEVQAQPHELAEDPRGFVAATKRGVVVELQKVWNSQGFPGGQAMADDCRAAFVGGNGLRARAGAQIEGMKRIDFGAVFEIATGPIERMQHPGHRRQRLRKVNRLREHGNHVMRLQDAFDSGERRRATAARR